MPFNIRPTWTIGFYFRDNNGKTSSTSLSLTGSVLFVEAQAAAAALADALQAVSNARLEDYSIGRTWTNDDTSPIPPESEVERKLRIPFGTAEFADITSLEIPSPVFGIETPGTDVVNPANPLVAAVIDAVLNGAPGTDNGFTTYYSDDLTRVGTPFVMHRNRRKSA